jgi:tRNA dimethylallyltransferase
MPRPENFPESTSRFDEFFTSSDKLKKKTAYIILGPTAVGKTAAAIQLASDLKTKIISADSRQCFKELNIGVAKPNLSELEMVPHYFINSHHIVEQVNAALFEQLALQAAEEIFRDHEKLLMVGGTGLYIKAFCEGLDEIPEIDKGIRAQVTEAYTTDGLRGLQEEIKKHDPDFYAFGEILNPQRLIRAIEVMRSTGRSILSFRSGQKKQRPFDIVKIGLQLPREVLNQHIEHRVDLMMQSGLLDEVNQLRDHKDLNALQTVGYTELFGYLEGRFTMPEAIALIKKNTRQYAKRQMTWFKKDLSVKWIAPDDYSHLKKITEA